MTSKKKWLIVAVLGAVLGVVAVGVVGVGLVLGVIPKPGEIFLPVYTFQQTSSTHPNYRRTTVTAGTNVFVQDFEEYAIRLAYSEPTNVIGRTRYGGGKICAIPGQKPTDYIAVDCGSEMPAYEVFRNSQLSPFDWRAVKFQTLEFTGDIGTTSHKRTTDPAVIEDVLRTLREGAPTTNPLPASVTSANVCGLHLLSDELPGLIFCAQVYRDAAGPVYLAENMVVEFTNRTTKIHAPWIPASPLFTQWLQSP
jgi:hypothetical protein